MDSLPAPLYIQCLLYIIGNLYNDNDEPIPGLGLLPRQLRIKLLLLLPVVDVCPLEGTSVTRDISMNDEIWERIFKATYNKTTYINHIVDVVSLVVSFYVNKKYTPWRDLYFTTMLHLRTSEFFEISDTELYMYFAQMKTSVIHGVIRKSRPQLTTRKIEYMIKTKDENEIFLDIATTMVYHKIQIKYLGLAYVRQLPFYFVRNSSSVEAIITNYHLPHYTDLIKQLLHIVFIENQCHIKFISIYEDALDLILPYLLQQCHLRKLELINCTEHIAKHLSELRELLKCHIHIEEVSLDCRLIEDYNLLQCFSELMSESAALQKLTLSCRTGVSFEVLKNFLARFFLSPYPVDLSLSFDTSSINFDTLPEPLPINFEQQSKSLSLSLLGTGDAPPNLSSLLPQHIVLHSLRINRKTISSFAKLKSIKVHKICVVMDVWIDISSLVNIVSAKEWDLTDEISLIWPELIPINRFNRFAEALATIATNLQQFHVNFCTWGDWCMGENILHKVFSSYFELIWDDTDTGYTDSIYSSNTDTNTISVYKYSTTYDTKYGTFKLKRLQAMDSESLNEMQA